MIFFSKKNFLEVKKMKNYEIDLGKNKLKLKFTDKPVTAYGGFVLLAEFLEKIKFKEAINRAFPVVEKSNNRITIFEKILALILIIFAGGERFSHLMYLGNQEGIKKIFNIKRLPLASTTLTRLFGKIISWQKAIKLSDNLWNYISQLIPFQKIKEDWLDFDSSVVCRYGKQEGANNGYNPEKKGRPCQNPIIGFLNKNKFIINLWNRSGNSKSSNNIENFFTETYMRIKDKIKILGVMADAGFYDLKFIQLLEKEKLTYIIRAILYQTLKNKILSIPKKEWKVKEYGIEIAEFKYKHEDWDIERRYIAIRQDIGVRKKATGKMLSLFEDIEEIDNRKYKYILFTTNSSEPAEVLWERLRKRSGDENTIRELKEDFAFEGFSMNKFFATEAGMMIRTLIYNIFLLFRIQIMEDKEKNNRLKTLRYKYFVIPSFFGKSGRYNILNINIHIDEIKTKFKTFIQKIFLYNPTIDLYNSIALQ